MLKNHSPYVSRGAEAQSIAVKSIEGKPTYGGDRRVKPLLMGEHLTFLEIRYAKGTGAPLHVHTHESVVYLVSGKLKTTISNDEFVLEPGDVLFFSLHLPRRSGPNTTPSPRRAVYITYSGARTSSPGERDAYYARYRRLMPPAGEQAEGESYAEGHAIYNWATPMARDQPHKKKI